MVWEKRRSINYTYRAFSSGYYFNNESFIPKAKGLKRLNLSKFLLILYSYSFINYYIFGEQVEAEFDLQCEVFDTNHYQVTTYLVGPKQSTIPEAMIFGDFHLTYNGFHSSRPTLALPVHTDHILGTLTLLALLAPPP